MYIWYLVIASFGGGIVSALLGWMDSGEGFMARKFTSSVLRSLVAGGIFAVGFSVNPVITGVSGLLIAALAGAGVDVLGNRLVGSIKK